MRTLGNCQDVLIRGYQAGENKSVSAHWQYVSLEVSFYTGCLNFIRELFLIISFWDFKNSSPHHSCSSPLVSQSLSTVLLMWTLSVKWCLSLITLQLVGNFLLKSCILIKPIAGSFGIIAINPTKSKTDLDFSFFVSSLTPSPPPTEIFLI